MELLEQTMTTLLERGLSPTLADFGGLSVVASAVDAVSASKFSADFVEIALEEAGDEPAAQLFAARVIARVQDDLSLNSLVEVLQVNRLADDLEEGIFDHWLKLSQDSSAAVITVRTASLLGALILKRNKARRALRLASAIASARLDDDPFYLAHAARVGGFLHSEEPHEGILEFLRDVVKVEEAADDANFELGLYNVGEALKEGDPARAKELMGFARVSFDSAAVAREARSDAKAFSIAINLLEGFYQRRPASEMAEWVAALKREAFAHSAYVYGSDGNPLLGSRGAQIAAWASLGMRVARLADEIDQAVWLEGIRVIEEELLTVYTASRTILGGQRAGGVEAIVSPRIQSSLLHNHAQALALRRWLSENSSSDKAAAAGELIGLVDDYIAGQPPNPLDAASGSPLLAALQGRAKELGAFDAASIAIAKVLEIESSKLSHAIMECLEAVRNEFMVVEMFAKYDEVMGVFLALALKTMLFIEHRLDATAAQDPAGAYLFENTDGRKALEKELQQDYLRFLRASKLGTHDEVRGLASGRADVFHEFGRVRIITEIKRESSAASFDALLENYGEQASAYENTNVPLGMLLALDLSKKQSVGQHISSLYKPFVGDFLEDGVTRGVLVVKIPGNRISPAVATERGRKRDRGGSPPTKKPAHRPAKRSA
jgi:hypothetical protein